MCISVPVAQLVVSCRSETRNRVLEDPSSNARKGNRFFLERISYSFIHFIDFDLVKNIIMNLL